VFAVFCALLLEVQSLLPPDALLPRHETSPFLLLLLLLHLLLLPRLGLLGRFVFLCCLSPLRLEPALPLLMLPSQQALPLLPLPLLHHPEVAAESREPK
jgi:hypothetical protein